VDIEEAVVLLQQAPAVESRPWLVRDAAAHTALISSADASFIGASVSVWHEGAIVLAPVRLNPEAMCESIWVLRPIRSLCRAGPQGADATAVLPPTDGRLELMLQAHTSAVGVAAHMQLLPLRLSLSAIDAVGRVVAAMTQSGKEQQPSHQQQQQEEQQQQLDLSARGTATLNRPQLHSPVAVAAAATVIIEDAPAALAEEGSAADEPAASAQAAFAGPGEADASRTGGQQPSDDLSAALFTYVHRSRDSSSRLAPLQVQALAGNDSDSHADESRPIGLRARLWGGSRQENAAEQQLLRQGIRWRYPQPRAVVLLLIEVSGL
jgi:hypothetical protein